MEVSEAIAQECNWTCNIPVLSNEFCFNTEENKIEQNNSNTPSSVNLMQFLTENVSLDVYRSILQYPKNAVFKFHINGLMNKTVIINYITDCARQNMTNLTHSECKSKAR